MNVDIILLERCCPSCEEVKPLGEFPRNRATKSGFGDWCKLCNNAYAKKRKRPLATAKALYNINLENLPKISLYEHIRSETLFKGTDADANCRNHNITQENFEAMLKSQHSRCAICSDFFDFDEGRKSIHIDHDHNCCPGQRSCGRCIRGLLCANCNLGLGRFKDDEVILTRAIKYLKKGIISELDNLEILDSPYEIL
jgi:hypothetical protein